MRHIVAPATEVAREQTKREPRSPFKKHLIVFIHTRFLLTAIDV
jgi:hypothetical protein